MKNNKFQILLSIFLLSNAMLLAQIDNSKSINKKFSNLYIAPSNKPLSRVKFIDPQADEKNFANALENALKEKIEEQNLKALKYKGLLDPEEIHRRRLKAEMKGLNRNLYAKIDQDLGGFSSNSKTATIICRDFGATDGDLVSISLNNRLVVRKIYLVQNFQKFTIPLDTGFNMISFEALNQGSSGPNTAEFMVFDDQGKLLTSNKWNLATGAKATFTIARDK